MILAEVQNQEDPYSLESGLFAAKSILDCLELHESNTTFVEKTFLSIIQSPYSVSHPTVARGGVLFIHEAC